MLCLRQFQIFQKFLQFFDRKRRYFGDISITHGNCQCALLQTLSFTLRTRRNIHKRLILRFRRLGMRLAITPLHAPDQSLERHVIDALAPLPFVIYFDSLSIRTVDQNIMDLFRIVFKRSVQIKFVFFTQCLKNRICKASLIRTGLPAKHRDCSLIDTFGRIRDHQFF